jgi:hypothetical protein
MDYLTGMERIVYIEPLAPLDMGNYGGATALGDDDNGDGDDGDDIPNPGGNGSGPIEPWRPGQQVAALFGRCDWLTAWLGLYLLNPTYVGGYAWAMVGSADEEF